jgi:hypothetical protein
MRKASESIVVLKNNLLEADHYRDVQRGIIFMAAQPTPLAPAPCPYANPFTWY